MLKTVYFFIGVSFRMKIVRNAGKMLYFYVVVSNKEGSKTKKRLRGCPLVHYGPCLELPTSRFALGW